MTTPAHQTTTRDVTVTADPAAPTIAIVREFDAPREAVYRAHTDADIVKQWLGPRRLKMAIDQWDARTGGSYRYTHSEPDGSGNYEFYGSFHEMRAPERMVQTFTFGGFPDGVSLDIATLTDLGDGRTRLHILSVLDSFEVRDAVLASGMETGLTEAYEQLDELLAG